MAVPGSISHIDISVGEPARSIRFYGALLEALGFRRMTPDMAGFSGDAPSRAWWSLDYPDGGRFGIEVRPAHPGKNARRYDRYEPGPHHIAFHARDRQHVDAVHEAVAAVCAATGGEVLDAPVDYSGQAGYSDGYYAAFFADPDGVKLEVVYLPGAH